MEDRGLLVPAIQAKGHQVRKYIGYLQPLVPEFERYNYVAQAMTELPDYMQRGWEDWKALALSGLPSAPPALGYREVPGWTRAIDAAHATGIPPSASPELPGVSCSGG